MHDICRGTYVILFVDSVFFPYFIPVVLTSLHLPTCWSSLLSCIFLFHTTPGASEGDEPRGPTGGPLARLLQYREGRAGRHARPRHLLPLGHPRTLRHREERARRRPQFAGQCQVAFRCYDQPDTPFFIPSHPFPSSCFPNIFLPSLLSLLTVYSYLLLVLHSLYPPSIPSRFLLLLIPLLLHLFYFFLFNILTLFLLHFFLVFLFFLLSPSAAWQALTFHTCIF